MALVLKDRVKETTTTTGTGTITLAGPAAGFQSFSAVGDANTTYYTIQDTDAGTWEVGIGTYTASGTTLSRDTVLSSSNGGSLVNFGAGTKDVFVTYPAEYAFGTAQTLAVASGGTGSTSLTANSVLLGNGASAVQTVAPGASGNVLKSNGTSWTSASAAANLQEFTSSGTWTKPDGVSTVLVELWGAGGGGGSGRVGLANSARLGGSGGGGGAYSYQLYDAADVPSSVTVTIGAGGAGGAARTTSNTNGANGSPGGTTTFGSLLSSFGGAGGTGGGISASAGAGGGGRTSAGSGANGGQPITVTASTTVANVFGGGGGNSGTQGQASIYGGSGGGGCSIAGLSGAGGLSIYGGGGANSGGGISSVNGTNSFVNTSRNYFGSNALGGSAIYPTTNDSYFPSVIGSNVFVAAEGGTTGNGGLIAYSSDGATFTTVFPNKGTLRGRVSGDGTNYVITTSTGVYRSTDLSNWTQISLSTDISWYNSLYANGKFIVVGVGGSAIAVSSDLTNWTTYNIPSTANAWNDIQYDGTYYVVFGLSGGVPYIARSTTGESWTLTSIPSDSFGGFSFAVSSSAWMLVALNTSNYTYNFYRSTDSGATWASVLATGGSTNWYLSYVNGGFVAVGDNTYQTSTDGSSWSGVSSVGGLTVLPNRAVLLGSTIVYAAATATAVRSSTTFTGWASSAILAQAENGTDGSNGLTASGGGGGGASTNGFNSGAGGTGGNGFARITAW